MDNHKSAKGLITGIPIAVMAVIVIALAVFLVYMAKDMRPPGSGDDVAEADEATGETTEADTVDIIETVEARETGERPEEWYGDLQSSAKIDREIDFSKYTEKCPDVYAWIEVPGTDIDYPIAYCEDAVEPFYYTHDIDGNADGAGMIITDSLNAKDFSDPETLIYGQAPDDGTMFSQLSLFKDEAFFEENDTINIYLHDAQLVYRIYACYTGSSDHILVNNDFNDPIQFMRFFDSIADVRDLSMNIREDAKPVLSDHAIALVTHCGDESKRLFVHAVLDEVRY